MKDHALFQRGDESREAKIIHIHFKIFSKAIGPCHKAMLGDGDSDLFKYFPMWVNYDF